MNNKEATPTNSSTYSIIPVNGIKQFLSSRDSNPRGNVTQGKGGNTYTKGETSEEIEWNETIEFIGGNSRGLYGEKKGISSINQGGLYDRFASGDVGIYTNWLDKDISEVTPTIVAFYCTKKGSFPSRNSTVLNHSARSAMVVMHNINLARQVGLPASEAEFNEQYKGHDFSTGLPEHLVSGVRKAIKLEASGTVPNYMSNKNFYAEWNRDMHSTIISPQKHTTDACSKQPAQWNDNTYQAGNGKNLIEHIRDKYGLESAQGKRFLLCSYANEKQSSLYVGDDSLTDWEFPTGITWSQLPEIKAICLDSKSRKDALKKVEALEALAIKKAKAMAEAEAKYDKENKI